MKAKKVALSQVQHSVSKFEATIIRAAVMCNDSFEVLARSLQASFVPYRASVLETRKSVCTQFH